MGKWRNMAQIVETEDDEFDNFADDIDIAFDNYVRCYDLIGDDEIWRITFDLRKQWFDYLCGLDLLRGFDIERSLAGLTSCFCQLPPALYKLECRRYQEISKIRGVIFGRPIEKKNDMRGDCTLNDIQNKMYDMHRDVKDMKRDIKGGFARNDDYARQQRLSVPPDLSGDRRGKWAYGWRLKMVNAVFTLFNNGSGRPFDNICHEVYAENESDFNKKGISYNSFKRACDRQKNHRKKLT
jgi:hypothetical protein